MKTNTRISVALATYNGARFIEDQLQSLITQTLKPCEIIISDDHSTDDTTTIISDFRSKTDIPIELYINKERLGYVENFNNALSHCSGDIVFLCDQDDVWFKNKIETHLLLHEQNPSVYVVMNDAMLVNERLESFGLTKLQQIRRLGLSPNFYIMGCSSSIKKCFLDAVLPVPRGYPSHDSWIIRLANLLHARLIHDSVLQHYRRHGANLSVLLYKPTEKISRLSYYLKVVKKESSQDPFKTELLKRFLLSIENTESQTAVQQQLREAVSQHLQDISFRRDLKALSLLPRTVHSLKYYFEGGYSRSYGYKSLMRDIFF